VAPAGFSDGTTTSADFSRRLLASPFQAQGEISPGKKTRLSSHNRRIYAILLWS
jgi:hypothetical protein